MQLCFVALQSFEIDSKQKVPIFLRCPVAVLGLEGNHLTRSPAVAREGRPYAGVRTLEDQQMIFVSCEKAYATFY